MYPPFTRLAVRLAPPEPDGVLLARFTRDRDEVAFAALVQRHGPTVYGVCRRILGNTADADDAFQAVFLVLVNRADALAGRPMLGDWLHGVAVRVALKARTAFARLRKYERRAAEYRTESVEDAPPVESSAWLDRELAALPERLRRPVLGCLIHERPRSEVAAELGIPEGTLASRLDAARKRLAKRLAHHRVPLVFAGLLVPVPASLAAATVNRATDGSGAVVHQLANEVTKSMISNKTGTILAIVGVLLVSASGMLLAIGQEKPSAPPRPAPQPEKKEPPEPQWMQKFREKYQLADGQFVKRVAPPYIPERIDFEYHDMYGSEKVAPEVDAENRKRAAELSMFMTMYVEQKGKNLQRRMTISSAYLKDRPDLQQGDNLLTVWDAVTNIADLESPEVMIDPASKNHPLFDQKNKTVHGDFVTLKGVPIGKLAPQLEKILRDECKVDVRLTVKEEEHTVYVVGGTFKAKPPEWRPKGQLDIYATENVLDKEYDHFNFNAPRKEPRKEYVQSAGYSGTPTNLMRFVGWRIRTRIVWDAPLPEGPKLSWNNHTVKDPSPDEEATDRDPEKVLKVVSEQTGLTFKKEKRKVPVLYLSAPPKK